MFWNITFIPLSDGDVKAIGLLLLAETEGETAE
jgi:hypothetical protein